MRKKTLCVLALIIFSACAPKQALLPAPEVVFVPVKLDFAKIQMPADVTTGIEAQGSAIYLDNQKTRVVFWKEDGTVQITAHEPADFFCFGGVQFVKVDRWYVYYDCQTGEIAASHEAYPTFAMEADLKNATTDLMWKSIDDHTESVTGWVYEAQLDGSLRVTSPLGDQLRVTKEKVTAIAENGSDGESIDRLDASGWFLSIGSHKDWLATLIKPTDRGWEYATIRP